MSVLVLFVAAEVFDEPFSGVLLGVLVALVSSMTFAIPDRKLRLRTLLLLPLAAIGGLLLGTALARSRIAMDVGFVAVIGVGMYVRRFGQAAGMGGFAAIMSYFATIFFRPGFGELGWLIASIILGAACGLVIVMYVPPEHPERRLPRLVEALRGRLIDLLGAVVANLGARRRDQGPNELLGAIAGRLAEAASGVQGLLADEATAAALWPGLDIDRLSIAIFDLQLAAERFGLVGDQLARATHGSPGRASDTVRDAVKQVGRALRARDARALKDSIASVQAAGEDLSAASDGVAVAARRTLSALQDTAGAMADLTALQPSAGRARAVASASSASAGAPARAAPSAGAAGGMLPTTRQAIQVSVAVALAIVVGELISPKHWSWCAITALILFTGTQSLEDTVAKGARRVAGTALAVPLGVLIGTGLAGAPGIAVPLIFVAYFLQSYLSAAFYTWAMFWMTLMLAILYGLLGSLGPGVLLTRIGETVAGAVVGVLVALLVLPTRRAELTRAAAKNYLDALAEFLRSASRRLVAGEPSSTLTTQTHTLEDRAQSLRAIAPARTGRVLPRSGHDTLRRSIRLLLSCDHHARELARESRPDHPAPTQPELVDAVRSAGDQVSQNAESAAALLNGGGGTIRSAGELIDAASDAAATARDEPLGDALRSLRFLDAGLADFANMLGVSDAHDRPAKMPRNSATASAGGSE